MDSYGYYDKYVMILIYKEVGSHVTKGTANRYSTLVEFMTCFANQY